MKMIQDWHDDPDKDTVTIEFDQGDLEKFVKPEVVQDIWAGMKQRANLVAPNDFTMTEIKLALKGKVIYERDDD